MATNAIAPCRVCGQPVSEYAPTCPHCGDPTAARYGHTPGRKTNPWMIIGWVLVAIIVLPIAMCTAMFPKHHVDQGIEHAEKSISESKKSP